jgi:acyl-CoA dehydrogenase
MSDNEIETLIEDVCKAKVTHQTVLEAEKTELLTELWGAFAELGLTEVGIAEEAGGPGGEFADVVSLLTVTARHSVPLPLLEHHLAVWAASSAGLPLEEGGPWTIAPGAEADTLRLDGGNASGTLHDVAWGASAARVVALVTTDAGTRVAVLDPADAQISHGRDLAGQPRDTLTFTGAAATVADSVVTVDDLRRRGAVLRGAQMAGAMDAVFELTRKYVATREQFGRPIGTFQAVQTHVVHLAEASVISNTSVGRAAAALDARDASFDVFAAKLLCDQYAAGSIRRSHQAHGAMGMTREYALQDSTRRLNAWRGDWGTEHQLAERIGAAVEAAGGVVRAATDAGSLAV